MAQLSSMASSCSSSADGTTQHTQASIMKGDTLLGSTTCSVRSSHSTLGLLCRTGTLLPSKDPPCLLTVSTLLFLEYHLEDPGCPVGPIPHPALEWMGVHCQTPVPAASPGRRRKGWDRLQSPREKRLEGYWESTSPNQTTSKSSLPSELIWQQLYLFHLSNYHIIKCMNYKRAKALN